MSIKRDKMIEELSKYISERTIKETEDRLENEGIDCTAEVMGILSILRNLSETTDEHADAEDSVFRQEDARQRAAQYQEAYDAIIAVYRD